MANSQGRKLYRVTLSAQERRDLKVIGHRGRLAPGTGPDAEGRDGAQLVDADIALGIAARRRSSACASAAGAGGRPQPQGAGEPSAETITQPDV